MSFTIYDDLLGKTIHNIVVKDDFLQMVTTDGDVWQMYHSQDCCESVYIEDIIGDLQDLIGNPILMAEEVTEGEFVAGCDSQVWTFYKFATIKGYVTIRWNGSSNGYYSVSVNFYKVEKDETDV